MGEIDAHIDEWAPIELEGVEVLFAPRERGKRTMPTASTFGYHWGKALKAAGLEGRGFTPHSLRRFFASTALAGGVPLLEVSRWLGHRSIKITADIYGHLTPDAPDRCRQVVQAAMGPRLQPVAGDQKAA